VHDLAAELRADRASSSGHRDPVETWSVIVWIICAVYLHLRFTLHWRGERLAWYAIAAMPIALFCLLGIPIVYHTAHAGYIGGVEG
jgi:ABC-type transport system involved in cytochrome c biogenesis permease subunit